MQGTLQKMMKVETLFHHLPAQWNYTGTLYRRPAAPAPATSRVGFASTIRFTGRSYMVIHFAKSSVWRAVMPTDRLDRRGGLDREYICGYHPPQNGSLRRCKSAHMRTRRERWQTSVRNVEPRSAGSSVRYAGRRFREVRHKHRTWRLRRHRFPSLSLRRLPSKKVPALRFFSSC